MPTDHLAIIGAAVAAVLAAAAIAALSGVPSVGDNAAIELRVRDVGTSDTPLLGPWSRYGFLYPGYPGPLLLWVLAAPYRLLGSTSLHAAAGVLAALAVVAGVLVARRSSQHVVALLAAVVLLALASAQGDLLLDPWNPWVPVVWYVELFLTCWRIAVGETALLPVAALLSSFLVQCHLQYAWPSVVLVGWSTAVGGLAAWRHRRSIHGRERRRVHQAWTRTALLVVAAVWACWIGPMVDHLTAETSNLGRIAAFVTADDGDEGVDPRTYRPGAALEEVGYVARPLGPWVTGRSSYWIDPSGRDVATLAASGALIVGILVALRRTGDRPAVLLLHGAVLGVAGAYVQMLSLRGPTAEYLVRFLWPIAACLWLAVFWGGWRALPGHLRCRLRSPARAALGAALVVVVVILAADVATRPAPTADERLVTDVGPALVAAIDDDAVVAVRHRGAVPFLPLDLTLLLERAGRTVTMGEPYRTRVGDHRVDRTPTVLVTVVERPEVDRWVADAAAGTDGLDLVLDRETADGRREREAAAASRRALLACRAGTEPELDDLIVRHAYGELRDRSGGVRRSDRTDLCCGGGLARCPGQRAVGSLRHLHPAGGVDR